MFILVTSHYNPHSLVSILLVATKQVKEKNEIKNQLVESEYEFDARITEENNID